jgi:hypothetical protein
MESCLHPLSLDSVSNDEVTMSKRQVVLTGGLWMALAAVAAQTPASAAGDREQTSPQLPTPEGRVTIVGCLVQGDPALKNGQASTAPGATATGDYFVRTPAIQVPVGTTLTIGGTAAERAGSTGGRATTSAGEPTRTALYRVTGLDRDELRTHLNQRIELSGRLRSDDEARGVTAKTTVDASGKPTTSVEKRMDVAGVIEATTLTMVSANCQ